MIQSDEKIYCASRALSLCGIALNADKNKHPDARNCAAFLFCPAREKYHNHYSGNWSKVGAESGIVRKHHQTNVQFMLIIPSKSNIIMIEIYVCCGNIS